MANTNIIYSIIIRVEESMALLEEVWGDSYASSPPQPTLSKCESEKNRLPIVETEKEAPKVATTPVVEQFTSNVPQKPNKNKSLPLFLALLATGACAIYAIDMFAATISKHG